MKGGWLVFLFFPFFKPQDGTGEMCSPNEEHLKSQIIISEIIMNQISGRN